MGASEIIGLLGGIALFLFGMAIMGDGLKKVAGSKLELVLYKLTSTPLKGVLLGQDVQAEGVRRLLHETIYNLCDNAIGYNVPGGSVRVTVSDAGENAVISVADTGIGIAPEHQSRIFERFYRVDKSHSKASGGTGLGLSIVKHAAAYHHGTVQLESQPGKGTTITVTIPRKQS